MFRYFFTDSREQDCYSSDLAHYVLSLMSPYSCMLDPCLREKVTRHVTPMTVGRAVDSYPSRKPVSPGILCENYIQGRYETSELLPLDRSVHFKGVIAPRRQDI